MREEMLLYPDWPAPENIFAAVTTRRGGYSSGAYAGLNLSPHVGDETETVNRNRELLAVELGFNAEYQWLRQVHGDKVITVKSPAAALEGDALVSRCAGIVCCVQTADCAPIFVCSRAGDEIAIIHAGWRGMCAGIIEQTVAAMQTRPSELLVWFGPAILTCHYEVGEEVRQAFLAGATNSTQRSMISMAFQPRGAPGKYHADLLRIAEVKLRGAGIVSISGGNQCTHCEPERYFSHRRDGICGRMANMICIRPVA